MLEDNRICIMISERDFAQELDFSREQRNIIIDTDIIIHISNTKSEEFLVWAFFDCFTRVLQLAVVA